MPIRADGQPAWGGYARDAVTGRRHVNGVIVVALSGGQVCDVVRFETTVVPYFGLPRTRD